MVRFLVKLQTKERDGIMSRRGDNIHKRKDGRWEGRYKSGYKNDGSTKYSSVYAKTYNECKLKLESLKAEKSQSIPRTKDLLFSDVIDFWLESNQIRLKGATQAKYRNITEAHIIPSLGGLKLSQINSFVVNSFLDKKIRSGGIISGKELSPSYVKTMAIIIESVIKFACSEGWCLPMKTPINKPVIPKSAPRVLNKYEEEKLLNALRHEQNCTATGTLIALNTGMRIGEVCALRWSDIDLENRLIHVRHTVSRVYDCCSERKTKLIIDSPKTQSSKRDLPMTETLVNVLSDAYKKRKSVFVVSDSENFVSPRTFDYNFRKMLKANELENVNFHALRHTFATRCAQVGMDAKALSRLLGHSTANISLNVYVHPSFDAVKQQLNLIYPDKNGQLSGQKIQTA